MSLDLASALAEAGIKLRSYSIGEHRAACPRCGAERHRPRDDALAVRIDDRGATWHCHRCGWSDAANDRSVGVRLGHRPSTVSPSAESTPRRWSSQADGLWSAGRPIAGTPVERYLTGRGCTLPPAGEEAIRFLPDAQHWQTQTRHPAMMALVTDAITAEKMSIHFTFLLVDGSDKAPVERSKLLMPGHQKAGGCIRLVEDAEVTLGLGLAEGIETALSVIASGWRPVWAAVDAGNLRAFPVLGGIEALSLFADRDPAGLVAAEAAAGRWRSAGREVVVLPAPELVEAA